jgi:hypothetical protein
MDETRSENRLLSSFAVLFQDVAFGLRQLRKSPGFAVVVAST